MFFRNLTLFRFPNGTLPRADEDLASVLASGALRELGPLELSVDGWVPPLATGAFTHVVGDFALITLGGSHRVLPSSIVHADVAKRITAIAEKQGRRVGARERKQIKEEVLSELIPRAFARPSRLSAYIDRRDGWLVVDTVRRRAAENVVDNVRSALGRFPAIPVAPEESPRVVMTDWLISDKLPAPLTFGDECVLRDPAEAGAVVRCRRQDLESDEVREHLKSGKQAFALGLTFDSRIAFTLDESLVLKRVRFLDDVLDQLSDESMDSAVAEADARFALMTLELRRLIEFLDTIFVFGERPEPRT